MVGRSSAFTGISLIDWLLIWSASLWVHGFPHFTMIWEEDTDKIVEMDKDIVLLARELATG